MSARADLIAAIIKLDPYAKTNERLVYWYNLIDAVEENALLTAANRAAVLLDEANPTSAYLRGDLLAAIDPPFPSGRYCMMSGHSDFHCPGRGPIHTDLIGKGFGISRVPGPSDAELRAETEADTELMRDEFHGRDTRGDINW